MRYSKWIKYWLITGCILIFFQIVIGGITRITGSGLSITKWEIVTGTFPPTSQVEWEKEFDLYKETPQYQKINQGMDLSEFKFIYFWEYFHRLWARMMGFVFLIPIFFFAYKKWLDSRLIKQLCFIFGSAMLAALFGWIMVKSGLVERPWVNAYKLSLHLGIALLTLAAVIWTYFIVAIKENNIYRMAAFSKLSKMFFGALLVQIFLGAVVSGMRASLYYPSWPDMNGEYIPSLLFDSSNWSWDAILEYDKDALMPALIHVLHRNWAYLVYGLGLYHAYKVLKYPFKRMVHIPQIMLIVFLNVQVLLGIMVLINSKTSIPVFYGVSHQAIAIFIFALALYNLYIFRSSKNLNESGSQSRGQV